MRWDLIFGNVQQEDKIFIDDKIYRIIKGEYKRKSKFYISHICEEIVWEFAFKFLICCLWLPIKIAAKKYIIWTSAVEILEDLNKYTLSEVLLMPIVR